MLSSALLQFIPVYNNKELACLQNTSKSNTTTVSKTLKPGPIVCTVERRPLAALGLNERTKN